ncbi:hypothetical protein [Streptomyces sp. RKAG337]|uniref:hypothetical protein n=1 Tax=Streptomyces sp. RKAG337 TaxID=2893404 RepID=UPI00203378FA|nr:hypothetical protein [Streptomyces sp. RKAG337]MCM2425034.1 hypothetical protein [Streptomyces sp. RKAG337]
MSVITQLADIYTGWMPTGATSLVLVGCWYWSVRTASRRAAELGGNDLSPPGRWCGSSRANTAQTPGSECKEAWQDLFLRDGLEDSSVVRAHHVALQVLRESIDSAHLDAYSDAPWPQHVVPSYHRALSLTETTDDVRSRTSDTGMGISVDVRDDSQFDVLLALAPYTIHAEAWCQGRQIFSASDTGTALWIAVTPQQELHLISRLQALGIERTAFTTHPRRRQRMFSR